MDPLFERRELTRKVHINAKAIQKNMATSLHQQLKGNYEGKCSSEGYIQPDSVSVVSYSLGRINMLKGGVDYDVIFQADTCLPHPGQVFKASVSLRSKIGIHADISPLKVLIPREIHIGNTDFDKAEIGQDIEFEVVGSQFKQLDRDIIVLGKLRSAIAPSPLMPLLGMEERVEIPEFKAPEGDEKVVTVTKTEPEKKKKRLKKPSIELPNEQVKAGILEGTD